MTERAFYSDRSCGKELKENTISSVSFGVHANVTILVKSRQILNLLCVEGVDLFYHIPHVMFIMPLYKQAFYDGELKPARDADSVF